MERMTTDKPVYEMSMMELAHNSCYTRDRIARYRDYETDKGARELVKELLAEYLNVPIEFSSDEDFDDYMHECLTEGPDSMIGLLAMLYLQIWSKAELREKLKYYEDLEAEGRLTIAPCKKGDSLWGYYTYPSYGIQEAKVLAVSTHDGETVISTDTYGVIPASDVGTNVFLDRMVAERLLTERKRKDKEKRKK